MLPYIAYMDPMGMDWFKGEISPDPPYDIMIFMGKSCGISEVS